MICAAIQRAEIRINSAYPDTSSEMLCCTGLQWSSLVNSDKGGVGLLYDLS
jgi:hypothetical protein